MRRNNSAEARAAMVEDRRARVASCKLQGMSIRQTAAALAKAKCVNPDTGKPWGVRAIHEDIQHLTERWQAEALRDISAVKAEQLAKLDEMEREAWAAWHRGIGRKQIRTSKTGGKDGDSTTLRTEVLNGDPRYLALVMDCQQRRAQLLGMDAPKRLEASGPNGGPIPMGHDLSGLDEAELAQLAVLVAKATPKEAEA